MLVLVIDIAAEHSGAATILDEFIEEFRADKDTKYIVALSSIYYENTSNITFLNFEWAKKTLFHRIWFDRFYCKSLVKKYHPDKIVSLQNCTVGANNVKQEVYFQNALPLSQYRISFRKSKALWLYQNVIGRIWKHSLKKANTVIVQAEWVKHTLSKNWHISEERIVVKKPIVVMPDVSIPKTESLDLFYPANGSVYKNHLLLLKALLRLNTEKQQKPSLILTGSLESLTYECQCMIKDNNLPVSFVGRLNKEQMAKYYSRSILVFPSLIETVGLPLMEAALLDRPIMASDLPYAREVLSGYGKCVFFNPLSEESFLEAYTELKYLIEKSE